jgi:hypothetical protein
MVLEALDERSALSHPIRMGVPFTTRLSNDGGMHCPKDLTAQIHFICEACTVRSVLGAEL